MNTRRRKIKKQRIRVSRAMRHATQSIAVGFGSCIALHGQYYSSRSVRPPEMSSILSDKEAALHDAIALRGDWNQAGDAIGSAMKKFSMDKSA